MTSTAFPGSSHYTFTIKKKKAEEKGNVGGKEGVDNYGSFPACKLWRKCNCLRNNFVSKHLDILCQF